MASIFYAFLCVCVLFCVCVCVFLTCSSVTDGPPNLCVYLVRMESTVSGRRERWRDGGNKVNTGNDSRGWGGKRQMDRGRESDEWIRKIKIVH